MKKKNDEGMGELLELLESHPELITALVFDPKSIASVLRGKAARRLVLGVDTKAFLRAVAESKGGPIALCLRRTALVRPKQCAGGTTPCPVFTVTLAPCFPCPCKTGTLQPSHVTGTPPRR